MGPFLYLCGFLALAASSFVLLQSPVLMLAPALGTIIAAIALFAFGKIVDEAAAIRRNTREVADYFQWLRKRQEDQAKRQAAALAPPGYVPEAQVVKKESWFSR